jgi:hypothetical protein
LYANTNKSFIPNIVSLFSGADGKPHIFGVLEERHKAVINSLHAIDQLSLWLTSVSDDIKKIVMTKFDD